MRVVRDDQIGPFAGIREIISLRAARQNDDAQFRRKTRGFGAPVVHDAFRADDEERVRVFSASSIRFAPHPKHPRERLQCFAETHVVGEDAAETIRAEIGEKVVTFDLIWTQLGKNSCR